MKAKKPSKETLWKRMLAADAAELAEFLKQLHDPKLDEGIYLIKDGWLVSEKGKKQFKEQKKPFENIEDGEAWVKEQGKPLRFISEWIDPKAFKDLPII